MRDTLTVKSTEGTSEGPYVVSVREGKVRGMVFGPREMSRRENVKEEGMFVVRTFESESLFFPSLKSIVF